MLPGNQRICSLATPGLVILDKGRSGCKMDHLMFVWVRMLIFPWWKSLSNYYESVQPGRCELLSGQKIVGEINLMFFRCIVLDFSVIPWQQCISLGESWWRLMDVEFVCVRTRSGCMDRILFAAMQCHAFMFPCMFMSKLFDSSSHAPGVQLPLCILLCFLWPWSF